jgi:hypothetical protein
MPGPWRTEAFTGGMTTAERRETEMRLKTPDTEERLVLASGRYLGEGFDDAALDTLFRRRAGVANRKVTPLPIPDGREAGSSCPHRRS